MARRAPDPASVAAAAPPTTVEPQLAASAAAAALAPSPSVRDSLDVEHYVPRVPLQLVAVAFALAAPALAPRAAVVPRPAEVLAVYVRDPVQSLSVAAALVAVVQVWFGYWARSCRAGAAHLRRQDAQRSAATRRLERSRTAARRTAPHGFRAVLGHIWNNPVGEWATPEGEAAVAGQPTLVGGIDYSFVPEAVLVTLLATLAFHVSAVLLGAPVFVDAGVTLLLSLLVALLAVTPLAIAVPPSQSTADRYVWLRLLSTLSPANDLEFALLAPALGAVIGCWSGAIPIPLDWDRPWQKYPTTLILGAVAGHAAGSLVSLATVSYRAVVRAAARALADSSSSSAKEEHRHDKTQQTKKKKQNHPPKRTTAGAAVAAAVAKARAKASSSSSSAAAAAETATSGKRPQDFDKHA